MRLRYAMRIYGYVVMPEHVHLLVSEPRSGTLADAMHFLKLSFAKRLKSKMAVPQSTVPQVRGRSLAANLGRMGVQTTSTPFWQKRYYDRNVRDEDEFRVKLRYLHRNPVARGLVNNPTDWKWSSFRHYALREQGPVEIESQWAATDRETELRGGPSRIFLSPGSRPFSGH
jgi:putative transposase